MHMPPSAMMQTKNAACAPGFDLTSIQLRTVLSSSVKRKRGFSWNHCIAVSAPFWSSAGGCIRRVKVCGAPPWPAALVQMNTDVSVSTPSLVCSEEGQRISRMKTDALLFELEELYKLWSVELESCCYVLDISQNLSGQGWWIMSTPVVSCSQTCRLSRTRSSWHTRSASGRQRSIRAMTSKTRTTLTMPCFLLGVYLTLPPFSLPPPPLSLSLSFSLSFLSLSLSLSLSLPHIWTWEVFYFQQTGTFRGDRQSASFTLLLDPLPCSPRLYWPWDPMSS